jgi:hypothetical protein
MQVELAPLIYKNDDEPQAVHLVALCEHYKQEASHGLHILFER